MKLDGVYAEDKKGCIRFRPAFPPSDAEMARVTERIRALSPGSSSAAAWGRKPIVTNRIPSGTASRCSPNSLALRFPGA
ncbi:MAG: hypothetical protein ABSH28_16785 [Acidobacteriota bacterium]|jgi:hypothetical protein